MRATQITTTFHHIDVILTRWMARHSISLVRYSIGIIFIWFGALKLVPGMSPASDLVQATIPFLPGSLVLAFLAAWEIVIGLGFVSGRFTRLTLLLLLPQMAGTALPLLMLPQYVYTSFPGLTLEGQYIIKNLVLISAALVVGATARGGQIVADPTE